MWSEGQKRFSYGPWTQKTSVEEALCPGSPCSCWVNAGLHYDLGCHGQMVSTQIHLWVETKLKDTFGSIKLKTTYNVTFVETGIIMKNITSPFLKKQTQTNAGLLCKMQIKTECEDLQIISVNPNLSKNRTKTTYHMLNLRNFYYFLENMCSI